jgi:hypothetical protein
MSNMEGFSLTHGESGHPPVTAEELQERLRVTEEKIRRDANEIVDVLRLDFPKFVDRVVRERFIAAPSADKLGDEDIKAIKDDIRRAGENASAEIIPALQDPALWLNIATVPAASDRHDLRGNDTIESRIQKVGAFVREVLRRHKLGAGDAEEVAYKLPTWFIGGRHMKSLVKSYWDHVEEYQAIKGELRARNDGEQRGKRLARWDAL